MKNYFKWIMLFLYLVAIGAVVNYYTAKYEKEKAEEQMENKQSDKTDTKIEIDTLIGEPIIKDSLMHQDFEQTKKLIEGGVLTHE